MFPTSGLDEKTRRERRRGGALRVDPIASRHYADREKAVVMSYLGRLVADGYAEWRDLNNGDIELRFHSGQRFLLANRTITRVA